jgi:hypothetical protein
MPEGDPNGRRIGNREALFLVDHKETNDETYNTVGR